MIYRDNGELVAECNECGEPHYGGTLEFPAFLADLKAKRWRIRKEEDEWKHVCPDCAS